jgi:hypothetical protein
MLCDRRTHGLSAVGFRDLPRVEGDAHQRALTLLNDSVPGPGRPTNITLGTACRQRELTLQTQPEPTEPDCQSVVGAPTTDAIAPAAKNAASCRPTKGNRPLSVACVPGGRAKRAYSRAPRRARQAVNAATP